MVKQLAHGFVKLVPKFVTVEFAKMLSGATQIYFLVKSYVS